VVVSAEHAELLRMKAALDLIGEGVVVYDGQGNLVFRNAPAERYLSSGPSDVLAAQAVADMLGHACAGEYREQALELVSPTRRTLSIRAFPLTEPGSGGAVAVVEDVSERQRLDAIRRDFVANVSHELKTPVGALSLLAEILDGEEDGEAVVRLARRISTEAERLVRIIDDLLDLSRIEANEDSQRELVPLESLIGQAVEPLRSVAASLDIPVGVEALPTGWAIPGDRRDLVSAVKNLVDNAIKYSEPGSPVTIRAVVRPGAVDIEVVDRGVGIPQRDRERIFERFYRVDRARSRTTGGTGLGLSIVRHVAANHGGSVRVESVEGEGSTFTLHIRAVPVADGGHLPTGEEVIA